MLGQILYHAKAGETEQCQIGDTTVLTVSVPKGKNIRGAYFARKAARLFERYRITLAAFPSEYPYIRKFTKRGIAAAESRMLYRKSAAEIALCALKELDRRPEEASVMICSDGYDTAAETAARKLAARVRYLTLCMPKGEEIAEKLRRQYGIAARLCVDCGGALCDLVLSFDSKTEDSEIPLLDFSAENFEADYMLPDRLQENGAISRELLSALAAYRDACAEELPVCRVRWRKVTDFP